MNDSTFNAHEYFQKIYERPVILEAKQLSQVFKHGQTEHTVLT
ncbi:ABC transporter ATP-binding protein, partial [Acinetobacter baumannii]